MIVSKISLKYLGALILASAPTFAASQSGGNYISVTAYQYEQCAALAKKHNEKTYISWVPGAVTICARTKDPHEIAMRNAISRCEKAKAGIKQFDIRDACKLAVSDGKIVDRQFRKATERLYTVPVTVTLDDKTANTRQEMKGKLTSRPMTFDKGVATKLYVEFVAKNVPICKGTASIVRGKRFSHKYSLNCFGEDFTGTNELDLLVKFDGYYGLFSKNFQLRTRKGSTIRITP